jgi:hypothetical protein
MDKLDGLGTASDANSDANPHVLLTRFPPSRHNLRRCARRVPRLELSAGTSSAVADTHDAYSNEGYEDYEGDADDQVAENVRGEQEVEQPAPGRPRQLNRNARQPRQRHVLMIMLLN